MFGDSYIDNDYVFNKHADGSLYYPDHPTKEFSKLRKRYPDLPQGITLRGLRCSCVSLLVHKGMDIKSIQKWVGHADINTTLKYYTKAKDREAKNETASVMGSMLKYKNDNK